MSHSYQRLMWLPVEWRMKEGKWSWDTVALRLKFPGGFVVIKL